MYFLKEFMKLYNVLTENIDSLRKMLQKIQYLLPRATEKMAGARKH